MRSRRAEVGAMAYVGSTSHDSLCAEDDGLESRSTDFVDRRTDGAIWEAGTQGTLSCGVLTQAG